MEARLAELQEKRNEAKVARETKLENAKVTLAEAVAKVTCRPSFPNAYHNVVPLGKHTDTVIRPNIKFAPSEPVARNHHTCTAKTLSCDDTPDMCTFCRLPGWYTSTTLLTSLLTVSAHNGTNQTS
eukprot:6092755-Pyramimonas_sp.AAC.1